MKKWKYLPIFLLAGVMCLATACGDKKPENPGGGNEPPAPDETYEQKTVAGMDPAFDESQGYYNESPSVFEEGGVRYLYYTRNTKKNDSSTDSIAVRKGTYTASGWVWGEPKTVLKTSESGWDGKAVFGADVVKGSFTYQSKNYSYLMAYSGSAQGKNRMHAQIGLAVSERPDGEFIRVGTNPVISFNVTDYDETGLGIAPYRGVVEPSLVSFDKAGKVLLFYTSYEKYNTSYVASLDASDLDHVAVYGRKALPTSGLLDVGATNPQLYCADYVYDAESKELLVVRNVSTVVTTEPKVSSAVQLLRASDTILSENNAGWVPEAETKVWWTKGAEIDDMNTAAEGEFFGYSRIFNACIASDPYGYLLEYGSYDVYFTTQAEYDVNNPNVYLFSQMIHELTVRG